MKLGIFSIIGAVIFAGAGLTGCGPTESLFPYYTEEAQVAAPNWLLGEWELVGRDRNNADGEKQLLRFAGNSAFLIIEYEDKHQKHFRIEGMHFDAVYFTVGGKQFVDVALGEEFDQWTGIPDSIKGLVVPVHMLLWLVPTGYREAKVRYLDEVDIPDESKTSDSNKKTLFSQSNDKPMNISSEMWMNILKSGTISSQNFADFSDLKKVEPIIGVHVNTPYSGALDQLARQKLRDCKAKSGKFVVEKEPRPIMTADFNSDGTPDPIISDQIFRCFNEKRSYELFSGGAVGTNWAVMMSDSHGGYKATEIVANNLDVVLSGDHPVLLLWFSGTVCQNAMDSDPCVVASIWNGRRFVSNSNQLSQ